jgi:hypothetical protein
MVFLLGNESPQGEIPALTGGGSPAGGWLKVLNGNEIDEAGVNQNVILVDSAPIWHLPNVFTVLCSRLHRV